VNQVAEENPYGSQIFAWVDASLAKFPRPVQKYKRPNYPPDQFSMFADNTMLYRGSRIKLIACFMVARPQIWDQVTRLFLQKLDEQQYSGYAHDEETILFLVRQQHPRLFASLG
jgi:hypothetical protein